jgi:lipopolysaccharide/colanic/teichoic acid biosynthesis glycosyltransferase
MAFYRDTALSHSQVRIGKKRKPIVVTKVRTMKSDAHREYYKDPEKYSSFNGNHDHRVTKLGRFLRSTKLDELPQLLNFFKGELSLIGWRPLPRDEYKSLPRDIRSFYDEFGPGLLGVAYALPKSKRTKENSFAEYRKFVALCKKSPLKARVKYLALIARNAYRK